MRINHNIIFRPDDKKIILFSFKNNVVFYDTLSYNLIIVLVRINGGTLTSLSLIFRVHTKNAPLQI